MEAKLEALNFNFEDDHFRVQEILKPIIENYQKLSREIDLYVVGWNKEKFHKDRHRSPTRKSTFA